MTLTVFVLPQDVLDSKNSAIRDLQYELARVCKVCSSPTPVLRREPGTEARYVYPASQFSVFIAQGDDLHSGYHNAGFICMLCRHTMT